MTEQPQSGSTDPTAAGWNPVSPPAGSGALAPLGSDSTEPGVTPWAAMALPTDTSPAPVGTEPLPDNPPAAPKPPTSPVIDRDDLPAATRLVAALAVLGIVAGVVWAAISPHSGGFVIGAHQVVPDETEQFVSGDGKFVLLTGVIGLIAGSYCWTLRARRGPVIAAALGLGGTLGAVLTALVGRLVGGGHTTGAVNSTIKLPITLHAHGLVALEGGVALLVYLVATLMSAPDDLGRPSAASTPGAAGAAVAIDHPAGDGESVRAGGHD